MRFLNVESVDALHATAIGILFESVEMRLK